MSDVGCLVGGRRNDDGKEVEDCEEKTQNGSHDYSLG